MNDAVRRRFARIGAIVRENHKLIVTAANESSERTSLHAESGTMKTMRSILHRPVRANLIKLVNIAKSKQTKVNINF